MIKYNDSNINGWNYGDDNIVKVYRNNAVVFYKFDSEQGGYKVCYAVVEDITQYSDREFEDVYDKATEKWYKLNNLNQYEEYGVYASGRTSCESSSSRLPQGYTEVEYVENTSTAYIDTGAYLDTSNFEIGYTIKDKQQLFGYCHQGCGSCTWLGVEQSATMLWGNFNNNANISSYLTSSENTIIFTQSGATINGTSISKTLSIGSDDIRNISLLIFARYDFKNNVVEHRTDSYMQVKSFYLKNNGTLVRDFVPAKRDSDNKYGLYDIVNDVFYLSPNGVDFIGGEPITPTDCVTTYNGKLTIDDGYEYEWNGSSWVNLGEVSESSVVEYIETPTSSPYAGIELLTSPSSQSTPMYYEVDCLVKSNQGDNNSILGQKSNRETVSYQMGFESYSSPFYDYGGGRLTTNWSAIGGLNNRIKVGFGVNSGDSKVVIKNLNTSTIVQSTTATPRNVTIPLLCNARYNTNTSGDNYAKSGQFRYYGIKIYDNNVLVGDYIPAKNPSTNEYTFYETISQRYCSKIGTGTIAGHETGTTEYPKYYSEKSEPLDNLTFYTLAEAQAYAEANCVYDGMHATIGTDRYYFDSTDENGWVKILEYYKFEDVTPSGGSGWTISGSSTYNPDSSYYDDFDLVTTSTSNATKIAKVTIYGYDHFTYYLRTSGYSSYCFAVATNVDEIQTPPSTMSYNSSSAITNTYNWNKSPKSAVNLSNYRRVTYNNLDKTVEHTFYVYFYGRTYSSYVGNATILIPKEQTNENWEQVTFSASSNVASVQKNLFIDGNYSTSGGAQYWYYRWIVGLPSGSHTSHTNYINYDYCPNVTSSTFTSVAGNSRQVNFTYDNTSNKNLSFRLTDGNGNVLTPSNTVYYNMTYYNSCGASASSSNVTFPRYQNVKVGGRFRFANSSNRHYIYGYSPNISLSTDYYVNNYQSTFDITYTKLSDEVVTITYTTYDPSDVKTPAFNTDITYPYSGGTTSSTTLTSYAVPYTYPYEVSQTSDKFSADSQSYTAGQAARTINFVLYPNNREFATVADLEAYAYAWEGMKATVGDVKYEYKNGEWVENQHSLPDVPFTVNYNAKQYNASTKTLLKTEGQLANVDAVITAGTPTVHDGYLTIASGTRATISGYQIYFNRTNSAPNLTIISKQRTDGGNCHMFANRDNNYNWMYRCYNNKLTLHGTGEQGSIAVTTQPVIESVRIDSNRLARYNNYTNNTSSTYSNFNYGGTNSGNFALFAGYANSTGEWFVGDFYWVYMCQGTLTDEQVQQVIDYNENL